jgi:hypothetical protein
VILFVTFHVLHLYIRTELPFILIYFQQDATLHSLFISGKLLYMFRVVSPTIIMSTHNCIYSIWYLSTVTATCRYCGRIGTGLSVVWELY